MQGDKAFKKVKRKFTNLSAKRDYEDELPEDSDKEVTTRRRIKQKLVKLRERLGDEIQEEGEYAKEKLKARISKLTDKLKKVESDELFYEDDDDDDEPSNIMGIKERIARLGGRFRKTDEDDDDFKECRSSEESHTSEDKLSTDGPTEGTVLSKIGQRLKERSGQVHRVSANKKRLNK